MSDHRGQGIHQDLLSAKLYVFVFVFFLGGGIYSLILIQKHTNIRTDVYLHTKCNYKSQWFVIAYVQVNICLYISVYMFMCV